MIDPLVTVGTNAIVLKDFIVGLICSKHKLLPRPTFTLTCTALRYLPDVFHVFLLCGK